MISDLGNVSIQYQPLVFYLSTSYNEDKGDSTLWIQILGVSLAHPNEIFQKQITYENTHLD